MAPSRYPPEGILDEEAGPEDLQAVFELESWTNDRVSDELGVLHRIPREEWVIGRPMSTVVMAAYCHPRQGGSRFSGPDRGAWYAGLSLETAHSESIFHRTAELAEVGVFDTRIQVRLYLADFGAEFLANSRDIRASTPANAPYHDPSTYAASQTLGRELLDAGVHGVLYKSVRHPEGECVACFRPRLVKNVRVGGHFEYRWNGSRAPQIVRMS